MMDDLKLKQFLQSSIAGRAETFRLAKNTRHSRELPRALIVEDQLFSRRLLYEFLVHDFKVDMAEDARHGLLLFMDHAPDIVFLDIELPDATGHTMAHMIKTLDPTTFIFMVTASNASTDVNEAINNHVDGFIIKPYNKGKIQEAVDKFLSHYNASRSKG